MHLLNRFSPRRACTLKARIADTRDRLYRVALAWCGDAMLAGDLVQETLAIGTSKHRQLRDEARLPAWLYGILNNAWRNHVCTRRPRDECDDAPPAASAGHRDSREETDLVMQVRHVVATLPTTERQVIALVDLGKMSYCEVAQVLDIPIGTVMNRLHRARERLLGRMERLSSAATTRRGHIHLVE